MKLLLLLFFLLIHIAFNPSASGSHTAFNCIAQDEAVPIVDCNYTFDEALKGLQIPQAILKQLTLIDVEYFSFDNRLHKGQIIINKKAVKDILEIFEIIKASRFPIAKVIPAVKYRWDDEASILNYSQI
ncbi:MAG: hypothetical protein Q8M94_19015 [Ignavibacteria bacterium]|nr:hypothetical protein [Ignavibacteria bacterium]